MRARLNVRRAREMHRCARGRASRILKTYTSDGKSGVKYKSVMPPKNSVGAELPIFRPRQSRRCSLFPFPPSPSQPLVARRFAFPHTLFRVPPEMLPPSFCFFFFFFASPITARSLNAAPYSDDARAHRQVRFRRVQFDTANEITHGASSASRASQTERERERERLMRTRGCAS